MPSGSYSYTLIDPPYDINTGTYRNVSVSQLNDAGQVLGTLSGSTGGSQPFLYADGSYTLLAPPGATSTTATQLGNNGQVIGRYSDAAGSHAFLYADGGYTDISVPGADFTTPLQITPGGQILADYFDSAGLHPVIDNNGSFTTLAVPGATSTSVRPNAGGSSGGLPFINDADQVIGSYTDDSGGHAFLYSDGGYTTLAVPGGFNTTAIEINAAGQVLGTYTPTPGNSTSNTRTFVYSDGNYTTIAPPGATSISSPQLNDAGQVAGSYYDGTRTQGFLETDGTFATISAPSTSISPAFVSISQLTNAGDVLGSSTGSTPGTSAPFVYSSGVSTDVGVPGAANTSAQRINDAGQLIGSFYDGATYHSFLATPLGTGAPPPADPTATAATDGAAGLVPPADGAVATMPDLGVPPNAVLA